MIMRVSMTKFAIIYHERYIGIILISFFLSFFVFQENLYADQKSENKFEIKKILSFSEIKELYSKPKNETVIFIDIDDVVITPEDWSLRSCDRKNPFKIIHFLLSKINSEDIDEKSFFQDRLSTLYISRKVMLVETLLPIYLNKLQKLGYQIIGITQINTGKCGKLDSVENWRIVELRKFSINFEKLNSYFDKKRIYPFPYFFIKGGIIFTDKLSKGDCIRDFLNENTKIKRVILIDDLLRNHKDVIKKIDISKIIFTGYHYVLAKKIPCNIVLEEANSQLKKLLEEGIWISSNK